MAKNDTVSYSYFIVSNNPEEHGFTGEPEEICQQYADAWTAGSSTRTCAFTYCISAEGLHHVHGVVEDAKAMRFSAVKKVFPSAHIEITKGSKSEAEAYIKKLPPYAEKGEIIIASVRHGEIQGRQGHRSDLKEIEALLEAGLTPNEIMNGKFSRRRYKNMICDAYFDSRIADTPIERDVTVHYHVGASGSGKSYTYVNLCKALGRNNIYFLTDKPASGGLDKYSAEKTLFWDELKPGSAELQTVFQMLDRYCAQIHSRYNNVYALWTEVHITSVYPPEILYSEMAGNQKNEPIEQFYRRITDIVYHEKIDGEYRTFTLPMEKYKGYDALRYAAYSDWNIQPYGEVG